jgi:uncharacterized protein (DUF1015 family)
MANIHPFRPWRYAASAGPIENLATQPYDTIPADLEAHYRTLGPHNLVHLIRPGSDYAGAAAHLAEWQREGVLARETAPAIYVYEQRFTVPDTGDDLVRRGFIALGGTEDYGPVVHRHEQTLDAPRADRFELLRHTRMQFGSIFMLYPDAAGAVEAPLDAATACAPEIEFTDHQRTRHSLWTIRDAATIAGVQRAMRDKPLVIADGHHRYETALQYRRAHPECAGATRTMMTFVRLESTGLRSLAAHRVISGLPAVPREALVAAARPLGSVAAPGAIAALGSIEALRAAWGATPAGRVRFGMALGDGSLWMLECARPAGALNLTVLHERVLGGVLGITPEAIASERFVRYRRGIDTAIDEVRRGDAQLAFLVEPLRVEEVARLALAGRTLPQKSTDFYPKLASGLTLYTLDD